MMQDPQQVERLRAKVEQIENAVRALQESSSLDWWEWLVRGGAMLAIILAVLRIRDHFATRGRLRIRPEFYYHAWEIPPKPTLKVKVVNLGRRPVTVDSIFGVLKAPNLWRRILWWWRKTSTFPLGQGDQSLEITEGSESTFDFKETGYTNIGLEDLRRVVVRDKVGRAWRSPREFGQSAYRAALEAELVDEQTRGEEGGRHAHFRFYKIAKNWHILGRLSAGNAATMPRRTYANRREADAVLTTFLERAEQFVAGEIEIDQVHDF